MTTFFYKKNSNFFAGEALTASEMTEIVRSAGKLSRHRVTAFAFEVIKGTRAGFDRGELLVLLQAFQSDCPLDYAEFSCLKGEFARALSEFVFWLSSSSEGENELYTQKQNAARAAKIVEDVFDISLCKTHEILMEENSGVFRSMQYESREYYLAELSRFAKKYKVAESKAAHVLVGFANSHDGDLGSFLLEKREIFASALSGKTIKFPSSKRQERRFVLLVMLSAIALSMAVMIGFSGGVISKLIVGQLAFFVSFNTIKVLAFALLSKTPDRHLPRLEISALGEEDKTLILIGKEVFSKEDIDEGMKKARAIKQEMDLPYIEVVPCFNLSYSPRELSDAESDLVEYAKKMGDCFFPARVKLGEGFEVPAVSSLLTEICRNALQGGSEGFLAVPSLSTPKYILTLADTDTITVENVQNLISTAKHPQNQKYNMFGLSERVDSEKTKNTAFTRLFSDSRGVFSDVVTAYDVLFKKYSVGVFTAPLNYGAGLIRVQEFFDRAEEKMPKNKALANFTLMSAYQGTAKVSDIEIERVYPATFGEYCRRMQRYVFGSFQLFPHIYTSPKNEKGKHKLSPLYGFIVYDGINNSLINLGNFLLLFIAVVSGEVLPVLLVLAGYLTMPLAGGGMKSLLRSAFAFLLLPVSFFLALSAISRAIYNLMTKRHNSPLTLSTDLFLLPNLLISALFLLIGGGVAVFCGAAWTIGAAAYYPLNRVRKPILKSARVLSEFGIIEPALRICENISQREILATPTEMPKYNLLSGGGYSVVTDDIGCGFSSYKGFVINKYDTMPFSSGSLLFVDGERQIPQKAIFDRDHTTLIAENQNHEITAKTVLLPYGIGEIRQIKIKNKTSKMRGFGVQISTEYALSKLNRYNQTEGAAPQAEIDGSAILGVDGVYTGETVQGKEGNFEWKNGVLTCTVRFDLPAGEEGSFFWVRVASENKEGVLRLLKRTRTYGFCNAAVRNSAVYEGLLRKGEDATDSFRLIQQQALERLMLSGVTARQPIGLEDGKRAAKGLNEMQSVCRAFTVLVEGWKVDQNSAVSALAKVSDAGLNFHAVFLYKGCNGTETENSCKQTKGLKYFVLCEDELSERERQSLRRDALFIVGEREEKNFAPALLYTRNKVNIAQPLPLPSRPQTNLLVGKGIASVCTSEQVSTAAANCFFTKRECFYIADRKKESFYTLTQFPLCGEGVQYSVNHTTLQTTYEANSKAESISAKIGLSPFSNCKTMGFTIAEKSGESREMSLALYFEIAAVSQYRLERKEEYIEVTNLSGQKLFLFLPQNAKHTFCHTQFFGRFNGLQNPRGVLEDFDTVQGVGGCLAVKIDFEMEGGEEKVFQFVMSTQKSLSNTEREGQVPMVKINTGNALIDNAGGEECLHRLMTEQNLWSLGLTDESFASAEFNPLATMYAQPLYVRKHILELCQRQLMRGDIRSLALNTIGGGCVKVSQSPLTLPLIASEYAKVSGDKDIFDQMVHYSKNRAIAECFEFGEGEIGERVYNHCVRAFRFCKVGEEGLVLSRTGVDLEASILYYVAAKSFLPYVTNHPFKLSLIINMEKIKEGVRKHIEPQPSAQKMCAYLAGILDFHDHPSEKSEIEQFIEEFITTAASQKRFSPLLYKLLQNRVIGIDFSGGNMSLRPKLMKNLDQANAEVAYLDSKYNITIKRTGKNKITVDGISYYNMEYIALRSGEKREIEVEI